MKPISIVKDVTDRTWDNCSEGMSAAGCMRMPKDRTLMAIIKRYNAVTAAID